tara:strand:+ start:622 stop:927 length:306 start_codon:yes stop_codon:yes gene_type:complete
MMNDIVLHFDDKISEYPGETSGFFSMILSLLFYAIGGVFIFVVGIGKVVTVSLLGVGFFFQMFIPVFGLIEMFISKGDISCDGVKNAMRGAGSVFWCCCYN